MKILLGTTECGLLKRAAEGAEPSTRKAVLSLLAKQGKEDNYPERFASTPDADVDELDACIRALSSALASGRIAVEFAAQAGRLIAELRRKCPVK